MKSEGENNVMVETNDEGNFVDSFNLKEKFANLPPSKEILEFYRQQIRNLEDDNEKTLKKLIEYKTFCDDYHVALSMVCNYEDEINKLQKSISDLQDYLFREKELNDNLRAELQALKSEKVRTSNVKSHRICKQLDDITSASEHTIKSDKAKDEEIQYLRRQLNNFTVSSKHRLEKFQAESRKRLEMLEEQRNEDAERMHVFTNKLKRAQDMLYESTRELLETKSAHKKEIFKCMEEMEKMTKVAKFSKREAANIAKETLLAVEQKTKGSERANNHLKHQVKKLEAEVANCREASKDATGQLEEQLRQTTECLVLLTKRHKDLEIRRKLEIEGYKTDIDVLKAKLEDAKEVVETCSKSFNFDAEDDYYDSDDDDDASHFEGVKEMKVKRKILRVPMCAKKCRPLKSHKFHFRK